MYEVMNWSGPMTNRQFRTWLVWQGISLNHPDRQDMYLMQVACEVRRVLMKNPGDVSIPDFRLQFGPEERRQDVRREPTKEDLERANANAHAKWIGAFAGKKIRGLNAPHPVDGSQVSGKKP